VLPIKTIIKRIRATLHDSDAITYDDEELVDVINNGIRFIRRTIAEIHPETLIETKKGLLQPGEDSVTLDKRPLKIIRVRSGDAVITESEGESDLIYNNNEIIYNNQKMIYAEPIRTLSFAKGRQKTLRATNLRHIPDEDEQGRPLAYYKTGLKTVHFWPVPKVETVYIIDTIDDIDEVTIDDKSPLISDFDDFLMEYVSLRMAIGNEYDESQETQIMMNIYNQIRDLLAPPPVGVIVHEYWHGGSRKGGGY
jgi:hypothetical protein